MDSLKENVSIRITTEDKLKIYKKADELYMTPSSLMRQIVLRNLQKY
ncbi:hypothetical protein [Sediminicola arcticus]|jgi:hypothetical protein|uniref:CopG family transcriptional regulator n=1 Tax=Sediminicola arcticus TaxID=1574308 RepID=A0ABV2SSC8_9FLAO